MALNLSRTTAALASIAALAFATVPLAAPAAPAHHHASPAHARLQHELHRVVEAGALSATARLDSTQADSGRLDSHRRVRASSGQAELGSARPVPHGARFRIGSVTKTFLATVALQLVAKHRLGLDDTVASHLPGVLGAGDRIKIRQLLNHSSGLHEVLETFPSPRSAEFLKLRWQTWTTAELVARVASKPLLFEPGTRASYSNTNYLVLAMVIEQVTGHSYAQEIKDRIILPLHLDATSLPGTDPILHGPHAHGYLPLDVDGDLHLADITEINPTIMNAAGEMISTTHDLNRFLAALLAGRLLPPELLGEMKTPFPESEYGLGINVLELSSCGITAYGKDGDAPGYSTVSYVAPTKHRAITVSVTWGTGNPGDAVDALVEAELCR